MGDDYTEKVTVTLKRSTIDSVDTLQRELGVKSRSLMMNLILEDWSEDSDSDIKLKLK